MSIKILGNIINYSDLSKLVSYENIKQATALSLWERFIDLFRVNKKKDVVNSLYNLINENSSSPADNTSRSKFCHFEQLRHLAESDHRSLFEINVSKLSNNYSRYFFIIDGVEILHIDNSLGWDTLSNIKYNDLSLIENYGEIIKHYAKLHEHSFRNEYPHTALTDSFGADEMLDYSCYFLKNNNDIRESLLEHGLVNCDILDHISTDIMERDDVDEDTKGKNIYSLQTLMGTLRVLGNFDGDYI